MIWWCTVHTSHLSWEGINCVGHGFGGVVQDSRQIRFWLQSMSSLHHAARIGGVHSSELLGDWTSLVFALIALHLGAVLVWVLLWVLQAFRGEGGSHVKLSEEKQD